MSARRVRREASGRSPQCNARAVPRRRHHDVVLQQPGRAAGRRAAGGLAHAAARPVRDGVARRRR